MDRSTEEKTMNIISSTQNSYLTQIIMVKVKSAIGFFDMSEHEMEQAGIYLNECRETQDPVCPETRSMLPFVQDKRRVE